MSDKRKIGKKKDRTTTQTITNFMKLQFFFFIAVVVAAAVVIANNTNCQRCYSSFARFQNGIVNGTDMLKRDRFRGVKQRGREARRKIHHGAAEQN